MNPRQREHLQSERNSAHIVFDRIWKKAKNPGFVRDIAYKWLADQLGIPRCRAHFSRLRGRQLRLAIRLARKVNAGRIIHWWKTKGQFQQQLQKAQNCQMNIHEPHPYHQAKVTERRYGPSNLIQHWRTCSQVPCLH